MRGVYNVSSAKRVQSSTPTGMERGVYDVGIAKRTQTSTSTIMEREQSPILAGAAGSALRNSFYRPGIANAATLKKRKESSVDEGFRSDLPKAGLKAALLENRPTRPLSKVLGGYLEDDDGIADTSADIKALIQEGSQLLTQLDTASGEELKAAQPRLSKENLNIAALGAIDSDVIAEAIKQASSDVQLLAHVQKSGETPIRSKIDLAGQHQRVQAALLRRTACEALMTMDAEHMKLKGELRSAKEEVKSLKHLQQTIRSRDQDNMNNLADKMSVQRQVDAIQDSVQHITSLVEMTLQCVQSHTRSVADEAEASLLEARQQVKEEQIRLQAECKISESLSSHVAALTAERDTAKETIVQLQQKLADLSDKMKISHRSKCKGLFQKWAIVVRLELLRNSFFLWRAQWQEQQQASLQAAFRDKYVEMLLSSLLLALTSCPYSL